MCATIKELCVLSDGGYPNIDETIKFILALRQNLQLYFFKVAIRMIVDFLWSTAN